MRSFAGVVQFDGSPPNPTLLRHLGALISLERSSPPVIESDDRCGIVVVTHREDLRAETERASGERVPSPSFGSCSSQLLARLHGEFSFAIWNSQTRELFCARDRFGARPFYYARTTRTFVFSDSLEAVIAHPEVRTDALREAAVADYLCTGVLQDAQATIYADVHRLAPAHVLRCRADGSIEIERYWRLPPHTSTRRGDDAVESLESALKEAIADRVGGPTALVFMSGGLDSPLLAALSREVRRETQLLAATSVYRTRIADVEGDYAAEAARSIGIPLRLFPLDDYPPLMALDPNVWTAEPGPLLTAPMTTDIYRDAADYAPIAMHGHPADAVLSIDLAGYLRRLPSSERAKQLIRYTRLRRRPPYFYFRRRRITPPPSRPAWLMVECEALPVPEDDPLASAEWSSYFEWAHPLVTRAPIELVYPWCDARVVEVARQLAPIPWLVDKWVLREMLRGRVSERIRRRKKSYVFQDPWRADLPVAGVPEIRAASRFIDPERFRRACQEAGHLSNDTLRAVLFESWLRKLADSPRRPAT